MFLPSVIFDNCSLLSLNSALFGALATLLQNIALLQNCSETRAPPLCPLSRPEAISLCLLALRSLAGAETNEKRYVSVCICVCPSHPATIQ